MKTNLKICPHCRCDLKARVSEDIAFHVHWVGDYFLIDVVLLVPEGSILHGSYREYLTTVLYREVYVVET